LNACAFQFVNQRQQRNLAGVGDGEHWTRAGDLSRERCSIVERRHLRLAESRDPQRA
jgi:hypothetical protein